MTEKEAMQKLIGKVVTVTRLTQWGLEEIVGSITTPLWIEDTSDEDEEVTHVTVTGQIVVNHINGMAIEEDTAITLEIWPIEEVTIL